MKARIIRRSIATYSGLACAIISILWIFLSDVYVHVEVKWLLITMCVLIAGSIAMMASYMLGNAESKAWIPLDLIGILFGLLYVILIPKNYSDAVYIKALKKSGSLFGIYNTLMFIIGIVLLIILVASAIVDVVLYFKLDKDKKL